MVAAVLLAAVVGLVVSLLAAGLRQQAGWSAQIVEHLEVTGDFPTVAQLRAGRVGWAAVRPPSPGQVPGTGRAIESASTSSRGAR